MATPTRPSRLAETGVPPATPITDFSALEGQKENIQPLSTGRSAHALSTIFAQRPKQLEKDLKDAQAKFENELTQCEERRKQELLGLSAGDDIESDPLDVFERYIKHIREVAPSGSTQSSILIPLLERCTRTLLAERDIWAQDVRYIRIWIQYSRLIERKTDVFDFLLAREIGTDWALLYEEHAVVLEGMGRRGEADAAYQLGIARKAKPLERLLQRHKAFQVRMLTAPPFISHPEPTSAAAAARSSRNTLSTISTTAAGTSLSIATPKANNGKRGGLAIFVDGEEEDDKKWEGEFGTRDAVRKENEREATSFKTAEVLPQGRGVAPRTPKLEVFRDDSTCATPSGVHSVEDVFTRSNTLSQWEQIVQDPLVNMRDLAIPLRTHSHSQLLNSSHSSASAQQPLAPSTAQAAVLAAQPRKKSSRAPPPPEHANGYVPGSLRWEIPDSTPPIAKNGKPELRKFKWDMVFREGKEWSFEECRARNMGVVMGGKDFWEGMDTDPPSKKTQSTPARASPVSIFQDAPSSVAPPKTPSIFTDPPAAAAPTLVPASTSSPSNPTPRLSAPLQQELVFVAPTPKATVPLVSSNPTPSAGSSPAPKVSSNPTPKARTRPSPTVNTKAALADVMDMYNAGAGDDSDEEDSDDSDEDEDDSFIHGGGGAIQMMAPEQGFVPPTPTPAQGALHASRPPPLFAHAPSALAASSIQEDVFSDQNTPPAPPRTMQQQEQPLAVIFRDENDVPSRTPGGPSRTPGASKTPARTPLSTRKPTFESFSDEPSAPAASSSSSVFVDESSENRNVAPPPTRESFATPMPESKQPFRRGLGLVTQQVTEEDEEEAEQREDDEYRSNRGVWDGRVGGFELMTPITERTAEYSTAGKTSMSQMTARSSMGASSMVGRAGILEEEEEEEEEKEVGDQAFVADDEQLEGEVISGEVAKDLLFPGDGERVGGEDRSMREETPGSEFDSFVDRSGLQTGPFALSDGYTIDHTVEQTGNMDTMNVVDIDRTEPLNIPQEALVASEEEVRASPLTATAAPSSPPPTQAALSTPPQPSTTPPPSALPSQLFQTLQPLPPAAVQSPLRPSVAKAIASSPIVPRPKFAGVPNPCNPLDPDIMNSLIATLDPPLAQLPGFKDFTSKTINRLDGLQKLAAKKARRGSTGSSKSGVGKDDTLFGEIDLAGDVFEIKEKIGEGGFGAVFLAKDVAAAEAAAGDATRDDDGSDDDDSDEDEGPSHLVALKVEKPSGIWEGLVLDRVHKRLEPTSLRSSIISSKGLYAFADESYLVLSYSSQGTLLDAVNSAAKLGIASPAAVTGGQGGMDELVCLFFAVELLKVVEGLHRAEIIHGDLKIDNCLVRLDEVPSSVAGGWTSQYDGEGGGGWSSKGVRMIDFGKSIDMSLFPEGQTFVAEWEVDQRDCVEMREARPWSYQTDYFGLASVFYCMLFGKYIETVAAPSQPGVNTKRYKIATPLKRYWQTDLWTRLFDLLLNPRLASSSNPNGALPIPDDLATIRKEMSAWVEEKCMKDGKNLRSLLKKLELGSLQGR